MGSEAALHDYPGVRGAVARTIEFAPDDKRLIAFLLSEQQLERDAMRAAMRRRLPHYMVPAEYIVLDSFPLSPNGKVDRRALDVMRLHNGTVAVADANAGNVETRLMRIWQTLLRTLDVKPADNFFDLGGHSLLGTTVVSKVQEIFGIELPLRVLFEAGTIEGMAAAVESAQPGRAARVAAAFLRVKRMSEHDIEAVLADSGRN